MGGMTNPSHTLTVERLRPNAQLPAYATEGAAGLDLACAFEDAQPRTLLPGLSVEVLERCALLEADLEARDQTIRQLPNGQSTSGGEVEPVRPSPIPDFVAIEHQGMAYFVAGDRVLRAPIRDDGLFMLSDAAPADPIACDDIDPGVLLDITMQLGR